MNESLRRRFTGALKGALGAALACLAPTSAGHQQDRADDERAEFARRVAAFDENAGERELERCARELAKLPDGLGAYFDLADAAAAASASRARLMERTAANFQRSEVVHWVRTNATDAVTDTWRRTALGLLRLHGSSNELSLLADLCIERAHDGAARAELVEPFQSALAGVLAREGTSVRQMSWLMDAAKPLRGPMIRAVGAAGDPEGLRWLVFNIDHPQHGSEALQEIGRLARHAPADVAFEVARSVKPLLSSPDPAIRKHALHILGDLRQTSAIPHLIRVLKVADTNGERGMAHTALRRVTALALPARADAWAAWYTKEELWFEEQGPVALERLASEQDAAVVAAIQQLSARCLHRDDVARALAPLVTEHDSPTIRAQACAALGRLRSGVADEALTSALEDEDERVRAAAGAALRTLAPAGAGAATR